MFDHANLIDPTEFGIVADYLRNPSSGIFFLAHVKSTSMLGPLAADLERSVGAPVPPGQFPMPIQRRLDEGSLLVSTSLSLRSLDPTKLVDVLTIPPDTICSVILAPPFYLVHTPGLFEGTLVRQSTREGSAPQN